MPIRIQILLSSSLGFIAAFSIGWIIFTLINLLMIINDDDQQPQQNPFHYTNSYYLITCIYSFCVTIFLCSSLRSFTNRKPVTKTSFLNLSSNNNNNNNDDNDDIDDDEQSLSLSSSSSSSTLTSSKTIGYSIGRLSQWLWLIFIIEMLLFTRNMFIFNEQRHLSTIYYVDIGLGDNGNNNNGHGHHQQKYMELWFYTIVSLIKMLLSRFVIYLIDETVANNDWDVGDSD
uniref:Uncharacterized protein DDB_G0267764-like n=1 Tax=Dermatophagoides pteronyssinus TaxID=6956 RepID=A0A6P6XS15_DERPT|nr:uncharacterized protein DDB_G0267764-like [Dermatophagoides pteronyssinus]